MRPAALAVALAVAGAGCARTGGALPLVDVTRGDLVITVEVTGALAAVDATAVKSPALPGMPLLKLAWLAAEGSEVAPGDRLVTLDADDLDGNLQAARSDADQATKQLERRRQQLVVSRREQDLRLMQAEADAHRAALKAAVPSDLVAPIDRKEQALDRELADRRLEQTRREIAASRRSDEVDLQDQIDSRDAALKRIAELEQSRALLTIAAPRAGTVVYGAGNGGEPRNVGDPMWQSSVIVQVVGLDAMVGNGQVDEIDAGRVAVHQPVALRLDALPDLALHGSVASVATSVQADSDADPNKRVQLEIAIAPTPGAGLRPGMRFRGEIEIERIAGATQVPGEAVFITAEGPFAYRDTGHGLERVALRVGRRSADAIEIESGLAAGDRVSRVDPEQQEAP